MQSLAEFLGVVDDRNPAPTVATREFPLEISVQDFCRGVLTSAEYRQSVLHRIVLGELPPAVETTMFHYAYGKPPDRVEVKDTTLQLEDLSTDEVKARILRLHALLDQVDAAVETPRATRGDWDDDIEAVH